MARQRQIGIGGLRISPRAKQLVNEVLDSHRLSAGPMTARFEQAVASLHDKRFGLMCNSGTSALQMALSALKEIHGWEDDAEVLVPALTFVASSNAVLYAGLRPVFVDVEPRFYTMDAADMRRRITTRTRAVMPVHVAGLPCDMDPILEIAESHGLRVVEDSCEAMFARYRGRPVGSFGDIACFSTYVAHLVTTGVGGVCITDDAELLTVMKSLMNHGRDSIYVRVDDDDGLEGRELFEVADRRFSFVRLGHSFRATEMEAALGVAQLEGWPSMWGHRQEIAARLTARLAGLADVLQLPRCRKDSDHAYMMYPLVVLGGGVQRDDLIFFLEDQGIETRYLLPLIDQPICRRLFGDLDDEFPVAARLNRNAFYVGCHPEMTEDDADYVADHLRSFFLDHDR